MSSKVNSSYGANNAYGQSETKKDRVSTGKSFGDFYAGDQEDDLDPQGHSQEELETASDGLSSIFGSFGSSRSTNNDDDRTNPSRSRTNNRSNVQHSEKDDHKVNHKHKAKPEFEKFSKFDENEEPEKLKEIAKTDPMPAFQVPMQIDRVFAPMPVQTTSAVIPTQMMEQIVQDVRLGINEMGLAEFQFDLKSDTLDGLKLKISTKDGQVYATFIAENVHVKETIDQGAQELVKALQDKGLQVVNLQVSVGADSGNSSGGNQGGFSQSGQGQSDRQNQNSRSYSHTENNRSDERSSNNISTTNTEYTL